ncbi:transcriptional regulator [Salmonella enterica subsp. diarizonae]|nr:transcriptional regulator [Salmonella enterica subsp. diarizonae]
MLELSMTLPIYVQNGGLFISRGKGVIRPVAWIPGRLFLLKKGTLKIQEEAQLFASMPGKVCCFGRIVDMLASKIFLLTSNFTGYILRLKWRITIRVP